MSRLKKGDTIECFSHDELKITEEGLTNDGYGFVETYDMTTMKWKIRITEVREAEKRNTQRDIGRSAQDLSITMPERS